MELSLSLNVREYCVGLVEKLVDEGTEIMKGEVPVKTGALRDSVHSERTGATTWFIGTDIEHAKYVENGRGPVFPVVKKALWWSELSVGSMGPVLGHPVAKAGPAKANKFVERTAAQIDGRDLN